MKPDRLTRLDKRSYVNATLVTAALLIAAASVNCGSGTSPSQQTSELALAVGDTPAGVSSLGVEIDGVRTVVKCAALPTSGLRFSGLPAGHVVLKVAAYGSLDCSGTPLYQSEDKPLELQPGMATVVSVVLLGNGIIDLSVTFEPLGTSPDGGSTDGGAATAIQLSNAPGDPRIALLSQNGVTLTAYGAKNDQGIPTELQTIETRRPGEAPVLTQLDSQGRIAGFLADVISASFRHNDDGTMTVHVESAAFSPYDLVMPDPFAAATSAAAPGITAPSATASGTTSDTSLLQSALSAASQTVGVDVSRCGNPENAAIVDVSVTTRDGTRVDSLAARTATLGHFELGLNLSSGPAETFDAACTGLAKVASLTCAGLDVLPEGSEPGICAAIAALANVASPGAYAACLTAFESARLFCKVTEAPVPPGGDVPSVPELICEQITTALAAFSDFPISVFAYARMPGSARTFSSPGVSVASDADSIPPLSIAIDDTCSTPPPPACTYALSPGSLQMTADGGDTTIQVTTNRADCAWVANSDASWLAVASGPSSGTQLVSISVQKNMTASPRVGHLDLLQLGARVTVTQAAPMATACTFQVQPTTRSTPAAGETFNVSVNSSDPSCSWQIQGLTAWTSVPASSWTGSRTVAVTVAPNAGANARLAALSFAGQSVSVSQAGSTATPASTPFGDPCAGLTITPASLSFGEQGGVGQFNVDAPPGCSWIATSSSPIPTITSGWMGFGPGVVQYDVSLNVGGPRQAIINIGPATHTINQAGASLYCAFGLSYIAKTFPATGGSASVDVASNFSLCQWTAKTDSPFISLGVLQKGLGGATVNYSVASNPSTAPRDGTIVFVNAVLNIHQEGLTPCAFEVSPQTTNILAAGGKATFQITAARTDCAWTVAPGAPEVHVAGSTSGRGPGPVDLIVDPNTATAPRSFAIGIAGQTVTINQDAAATATMPLTISISGGGIIAVQSGTTGQTCSTASCTFTFAPGTQVTLTQAGGGRLTAWGQDCAAAGSDGCTLIMSSPHAVSATFGATTPQLTVDARGIGAVFVSPPRLWVNGGDLVVFSLAEGTEVHLASIGQLDGSYGGACAPAGNLAYCKVVVHGATNVVVPFVTRADTPQVAGNVRTLSFGTVGVGQSKQIVERWMPPGTNLRFSFLSKQQRDDFIQLMDEEPTTSIGGFSLPFGNYFTWPSVRNGQNVMYQLAPTTGTAGAGQTIAIPLYWWYDSIGADNVIMLTGTAVP